MAVPEPSLDVTLDLLRLGSVGIVSSVFTTWLGFAKYVRERRWEHMREAYASVVEETWKVLDMLASMRHWDEKGDTFDGATFQRKLAGMMAGLEHLRKLRAIGEFTLSRDAVRAIGEFVDSFRAAIPEDPERTERAQWRSIGNDLQILAASFSASIIAIGQRDLESVMTRPVMFRQILGRR